ncbi:MAG: ABC transporter substrate-binding protein, partial [Saccharopolyspora sp.]|nr:ABC transporter substrate-binding protein [Saccharopolyspora sp.]
PAGGEAAAPASTSPQSAGGASGGPLEPNSPAERDLIAALQAPSLHRQPSEVPEWSSLLVGPVYRGTEVQLR